MITIVYGNSKSALKAFNLCMILTLKEDEKVFYSNRLKETDTNILQNGILILPVNSPLVSYQNQDSTKTRLFLHLCMQARPRGLSIIVPVLVKESKPFEVGVRYSRMSFYKVIQLKSKRGKPYRFKIKDLARRRYSVWNISRGIKDVREYSLDNDERRKES